MKPTAAKETKCLVSEKTMTTLASNAERIQNITYIQSIVLSSIEWHGWACVIDSNHYRSSRTCKNLVVFFVFWNDPKFLIDIQGLRGRQKWVLCKVFLHQVLRTLPYLLISQFLCGIISQNLEQGVGKDPSGFSCFAVGYILGLFVILTSRYQMDCCRNVLLCLFDGYLFLFYCHSTTPSPRYYVLSIHSVLLLEAIPTMSWKCISNRPELSRGQIWVCDNFTVMHFSFVGRSSRLVYSRSRMMNDPIIWGIYHARFLLFAPTQLLCFCFQSTKIKATLTERQLSVWHLWISAQEVRRCRSSVSLTDLNQ